MAKALDAHGTRFISAPGGAVEWRRELTRELIGRQQPDGSWINTDSARWMERDPVLATSYAVLALMRAAEGL
jgi:squalene-hopene/tetraprenyl-beta-curcumene cyclase